MPKRHEKKGAKFFAGKNLGGKSQIHLILSLKIFAPLVNTISLAQFMGSVIRGAASQQPANDGEDGITAV
jgi:hypothetical protein